jgi:DNA repair exonuclease SbcCD ATPase subunit/predicted phosphodiesterase
METTLRFAHIADTHIRNLKYHFEYKDIFQQLYKSLREEKVDYIIHCGDIAHTKTQISPEFVDLCRDFFENLAQIAPTYIILGNHDGNLRNDSRQDAISPIVRAINNPNLILLRNAGETKLNDKFCLNVLSVFDEENWTQPTDKNLVNIALYHGAIDRSKTDSDWTLGGDHDISIFDNFDFAFLGDIHKTQKLDKEGRIWYAGSTVQQNFGESLDKGYLLWDIKDRNDFSNRLITFTNPKPFVTLQLTDKGNLPRQIPPEGARVRIVSKTNVSVDKIKKAIDIAKFKYNPESVTYLNKAAAQQIQVSAPEGLKAQDLRDIKVQEEIMAKYLEEYETTDEVLEKVYELNKKYNKEIEEDEEVLRNINWSIKSLEWDNTFNYGEGNSVDFTNLEGIVGIFGKNYSGKSSIVDTLLYALYNTTSKSIRKSYNIINQNRNECFAKATIEIDGKNYFVERTSKKDIKKRTGEDTQTAITDLEFYSEDEVGENTGLNGTSRQDTDKNVRKYFGTHKDFLMTSMASQLDSFSFINEGSTNRKSFLAKFLDLQIFDQKFERAKKESASIKAALSRLEGTDFEAAIDKVKSEITKSELGIESNRAICVGLKEELFEQQTELKALEEKINSVPSEVIDPVLTARKIAEKEKRILDITAKKTQAQKTLSEDEVKFENIEDFLGKFDIDSYQEKKQKIEKFSKELDEMINILDKESREIDRNIKKQDLLSQVPCGSQFPSCKFIKDAHEAEGLIQISESKRGAAAKRSNELGEELVALEPLKVNDHIDKYNQLVDKKNGLANSIASSKLIVERADNLLFKEQVELEELNAKSAEYEENKEAIENLKQLMFQRDEAKRSVKQKNDKLDDCETKIMQLHKKHGSLEQKLEHVQQQLEEYESLKQEFAAYHLFMVCCHPNGVSYEIIKERLPLINEEISKILTNIVEFEVFITNNEDKLDIFIKHPKHDPRPLEQGSGAEKTIAQMAIRLAFLTVSSLPKSDLFILDEPATALDEENMEGFIRILDMIKGYFKTVLLISHLDSLKDCVDMQINIEKKGDFASVNI